MDPFLVFGCLVLIVAKCLELLSAFRLFLIHIITSWFQTLLGYDYKVPKNLEPLQEEMRRTMVTWTHAECNSFDQLRISALHVQCQSPQETKDEDMAEIIQNLESCQNISRQQSYNFFAIFQRTTKSSFWAKLPKFIFGFIFAFGIAFAICHLLELRLLNAVGIYTIHTLEISKAPLHDRLIAAALITIATYFWHTAIVLLSNAKERAVAKRDIIV